jgi:hypothetical protein
LDKFLTKTYMKKPQPIANLVRQILPEFEDPPSSPQIQQILHDYWHKEAGLIAPYTRPFLYESGRLVIFCDSPAWSNQVRHQIPSLTRQVREQGFNISEIVIKTIPISKPPVSKENAYKNTTFLSSENAKAINRASTRINHKGLKESLKRLAKRSGNPD